MLLQCLQNKKSGFLGLLFSPCKGGLDSSVNFCRGGAFRKQSRCWRPVAQSGPQWKRTQFRVSVCTAGCPVPAKPRARGYVFVHTSKFTSVQLPLGGLLFCSGDSAHSLPTLWQGPQP